MECLVLYLNIWTHMTSGCIWTTSEEFLQSELTSFSGWIRPKLPSSTPSLVVSFTDHCHRILHHQKKNRNTVIQEISNRTHVSRTPKKTWVSHTSSSSKLRVPLVRSPFNFWWEITNSEDQKAMVHFFFAYTYICWFPKSCFSRNISYNMESSLMIRGKMHTKWNCELDSKCG